MNDSKSEINDLGDFQDVIVTAKVAPTKIFSIPEKHAAVDAEYKRLRTIPGRAERRALRSKLTPQLEAARATQKKKAAIFGNSAKSGVDLCVHQLILGNRRLPLGGWHCDLAYPLKSVVRFFLSKGCQELAIAEGSVPCLLALL